MKRTTIPMGDRLALLQEIDSFRPWASLDESRQCVLCDRVFTGRQIRLERDGRGRIQLHCPTTECPATPREWTMPGNPLIDDQVWKDWLVILDEVPVPPVAKTESRRKKVRLAD